MNLEIGGIAEDRPVYHEKFTLEFLKVAIAQRFNNSLFGSFTEKNTEIWIREIGETLMFQLESYVMGQHNYQKYRVGVQIPKNWWEHFKRDHLPKWWSNRWPVKNTIVWRVVEFDHKKIYPESNINVPGGLGNVMFHTTCDEPDVYKP